MKRAMIVAALILFGLAIAKSFGAMDRDHHQRDAFSWSDVTPNDGWIHIRNTNGSIRIEESPNDSVFVKASMSWSGSPEKVSFVANRVDDDIYICAMHGGGDESHCGENTYRNRQRSWFARRFWKVRPVTVQFTVYAPSTARIDAKTANGRITSDAPLVAMVADTKNGRIEANEPVQSIRATTYNGKVSAVLADGLLAEDVVLETWNGSVTVELPEDVNVHLAYETRHGSITNDFATVSSEGSSRSGRHSGTYTIGEGGPSVTLSTRNGSIRINRRPAQAPAADSSLVATVK